MKGRLMIATRTVETNRISAKKTVVAPRPNQGWSREWPPLGGGTGSQSARIHPDFGAATGAAFEGKNPFLLRAIASSDLSASTSAGRSLASRSRAAADQLINSATYGRRP